MAVSKMKLVKVIGKYESLDKVIEICAKSGAYHPEYVSEITDDIGRFTRINDINPYTETMTTLNDIFTSLAIKPSETDIFDNYEAMEFSQLNTIVNDIKSTLNDLQERKTNTGHGIDYVERTLEQLEHFKGLDIHLSKIFETKFIKVRFGKIPRESYKKLDEYKDNPYIMFFPISSDTSYYWGMYVAPFSGSEEADRVFSSLLFQRMHISSAATTPLHAIEILNKQHQEAKKELASIEASIANLVTNNSEKLNGIYSFVKQKHEIFEMRKLCVRYKNSFMQVGWVPENEVKKLTEKIDKIDGVSYTAESPSSTNIKTTPPTKLKNPRLFRPFEYYVTMYGSPGYREFDPTIFVAITYTIFYGIMFADLGQGLLLSLIGYFMYRKKGMEIGKILIPCGISGAFFGLVFGSVFGFENALNPLYKLFGFEEKPIEIMHSAMLLLMLSIALGVLLIATAMIINITCCIKRGQMGRAIFNPNGFCGLSVFISVLVVGLASYFEVSGFPVALIATIFTVIPMILLLFSVPLANAIDKNSQNKIESWGEYMLESFFELFETFLSYVTNAISFMRVGAFVLVHAGMMLVFFSIADLVGGGFAGAIVIVFGNILVIVLEGLLVGVQALRLEFYEMFSRFFEGNGKVFEPIKLKSQKSNKA